jgi:hypothetical protein
MMVKFMKPKICIALSFDAKFFYQAKECIRTIKKYFSYQMDVDICVLGIHLEKDQQSWLLEQDVVLTDSYGGLPKYKGVFPAHAYSQLCRPYLQELFPGYDVYMWVDADIRFTRSDAFEYFLSNALSSSASIAICQEVDPLYGIVHDPNLAFGYHTMINNRISAIYSYEIQKQLYYYYHFNTGIWAMHRDSRVWSCFKSELDHAFSHGYVHMREQDAMNVAILKCGEKPVILSPTFNWLCAMALPKLDPLIEGFVRPAFPHTPISVLHLIASESYLPNQGQEKKWYDLYRHLKLTE